MELQKLNPLIFMLTLIFALNQNLYAADEDTDDLFNTPKMSAIENRNYKVDSEFGFFIGISPLDAFNKSAMLGMSYYRSLGNVWGWEAINIQAASNIDTGLKRDLLDEFGVEPNGILDFVTATVTTGAVYTPFYSKHLLFNESIVYGELSFVMNVGAVTYNSGDSAPMVGVGVIPRFFISKDYSFKTDIRLQYHTAQQKSSNLLLNINFGIAVHY